MDAAMDGLDGFRIGFLAVCDGNAPGRYFSSKW